MLRLPPSSADPVGDAIAAAGEVISRYPDEPVDLEDLREYIGVQELERPMQGFNTVIGFWEEISMYADMEDGIELALAEQPGIEELDHPDREEMLVRTNLALEDVHAAAIRAVLEVNRHPRELPPLGLPMTVISGLAEGLVADLDWPGQLRMDVQRMERQRRDPRTNEPGVLDGLHGAYRAGEPGLLQIVHLWYGLGSIGDRIDLEGTITIRLAVFDAEEVRDTGGREFPIGICVGEKTVYAVPATVDDVTRATREALPWFDTVATRQSIVDGWVTGSSGYAAPYPLWEKIEVAARWGLREGAIALLRYGYRRERQHSPRFDALAQRYGLEEEVRSERSWQ